MFAAFLADLYHKSRLRSVDILLQRRSLAALWCHKSSLFRSCHFLALVSI